MARSWGKIGDRINIVSDLVDTENYGRELLIVNARLLLKHLCIYIKTIFDMNNIVWKMAKPNDGYEWPICAAAKDENITYFTSFKYTDLWTNFIYNMPLTDTIYARGGVALFIFLFSGVIWILQERCRFLIVLLPIIANSGMLLIAVPAQDPRYILPGIECAIFLIAIIFGPDREKSNLHNVEQVESGI